MQNTPLLAPPPVAADGLGELTRRLVQLLRQGAGRGPDTAHCHWAGPDTLLALFSDATTRVEETLTNNGEHEVALRYRAALQQALEDDMKAAESPPRGAP